VPISACGGDVRIIASIEDPAVINQILAHLVNKARPADWPISRNGSISEAITLDTPGSGDERKAELI
jgi:hypothetical protein